MAVAINIVATDSIVMKVGAPLLFMMLRPCVLDIGAIPTMTLTIAAAAARRAGMEGIAIRDTVHPINMIR